MNKIKFYNGGKIWYTTNDCYLDKKEFKISDIQKKYIKSDLIWDMKEFFEKNLKLEVDFDNNVWFNEDQTKHFSIDDDKEIIIDYSDLNENKFNIVAVLNISDANSFGFFNDLKDFELIYLKMYEFILVKLYVNNSNNKKSIEQSAAIAHEQWSGWMKYLFEKSTQNADGTVTIPKWAVDRWTRQMNTEYNKLSEQEKESDRIEAKKYMD